MQRGTCKCLYSSAPTNGYWAVSDFPQLFSLLPMCFWCFLHVEAGREGKVNQGMYHTAMTMSEVRKVTLLITCYPVTCAHVPRLWGTPVHLPFGPHLPSYTMQTTSRMNLGCRRNMEWVCRRCGPGEACAKLCWDAEQLLEAKGSRVHQNDFSGFIVPRCPGATS